MAFEKYVTHRGSRKPVRQGYVSPSNSDIYVSMGMDGDIYMNQRALIYLGDPKAVNLYFDKDNLQIGIKAAQSNDPDAYTLTTRGGTRKGEHNTGTGKKLHASAFMAHYSLSFQRERRIAMDSRLRDDMIVIDL